MRLTLLTAVRNEGRSIKEFMDYHARYFDEVVVVHDGQCTDDTLDIARQYDNASVYELPGKHNPHPHREWALRHAIDGGWVVILDSDELLDQRCLDELAALIEMADAEGRDGIAIIMRLMIDEFLVGEFPVWRIFKHSDAIHHAEHPHGGIEGLTSGELTDYVFVNRMRAVDIPSKNRRRNAILRHLIRENPDSPRREAWEAGLRVAETYYINVLDRAGVSLDVNEPLSSISGISERFAQALSEIGIETPQELARGDTEYIARTTGFSGSHVSRAQRKILT